MGMNSNNSYDNISATTPPIQSESTKKVETEDSRQVIAKAKVSFKSNVNLKQKNNKKSLVSLSFKGGVFNPVKI